MNSLSQYKFFDSHFHIIAPGYPLFENQGFLPEYFTCDDYLHRLQLYQLAGGVVVSGSFQGYDQSYMTSALKALGSNYVGVTQLPYDVSDQEIVRLSHIGVRGIRFNLVRGLVSDISQLKRFAQRIFSLARMHVELYLDAKDLDELAGLILSLPAVSIAHMGLSKEGLPNLCKVAEQGVRIKATRFGCLDFDPVEAIQQIATINPDVLMFGSDLPSTRAPRPYQDDDFMQIAEKFDENLAEKIFYQNALAFYQPA